MTDANHMPLAWLAQALAYVIEADNRVTFEEKAKMITALGKHVGRGDISQNQLHAMVAEAFERAQHTPVEKFIDEITPALTPAQKISIVINLYDAMLVDGRVVAGERKVLDLFIGAFDISRNTVRAIREITLLKNDTGLFVDSDHPHNEPDYRLEIQMVGAFEADTPPELNYKPVDKS